MAKKKISTSLNLHQSKLYFQWSDWNEQDKIYVVMMMMMIIIFEIIVIIIIIYSISRLIIGSHNRIQQMNHTGQESLLAVVRPVGWLLQVEPRSSTRDYLVQIQPVARAGLEIRITRSTIQLLNCSVTLPHDHVIVTLSCPVICGDWSGRQIKHKRLRISYHSFKQILSDVVFL